MRPVVNALRQPCGSFHGQSGGRAAKTTDDTEGIDDESR
jgi:hypothetical protein